MCDEQKKNQTSQAFLFDCSCKFVCWPQNVWSTNACQIQAFQDNLRPHFDISPADPNCSSLNWRSSRHGVATLYSFWVVLYRQLAISLHTLLCMTFHIIDHEEMSEPGFLNKVAFLSSCRDSGFKTVIVHNILYSSSQSRWEQPK